MFSDMNTPAVGNSNYSNPRIQEENTFKGCTIIKSQAMPQGQKAKWVLEWKVPGRMDTVQDYFNDNDTEARREYLVGHLKEIYRALGTPITAESINGKQALELLQQLDNCKDKAVTIKITRRENPAQPNNPFWNTRYMNEIAVANAEDTAESSIAQLFA